MPDGLRMIAGNSKATSAQSIEKVAFWCDSAPGLTAQITIPDCQPGDSIVMAVVFPQCWDGIHLDSSDHMSHMAYPTYGIGCPASHPIGIPALTIHAQWLVPANGLHGARLASDMYAGSQPGGYSAHADFIEGWDPVVRNAFTDNCIHAGIDCEVRALGDGRTLVDPTTVPGARPNESTTPAASPSLSEMLCIIKPGG
jgi:hypothetical protein